MWWYNKLCSSHIQLYSTMLLQQCTSYECLRPPARTGEGLVCTVLYCNKPYFILYYCTNLYCIVWYCNKLFCILSYFTNLYCTKLYWFREGYSLPHLAPDHGTLTVLFVLCSGLVCSIAGIFARILCFITGILILKNIIGYICFLFHFWIWNTCHWTA